MSKARKAQQKNRFSLELLKFHPASDGQRDAAWMYEDSEKNLILGGSAGTGKTYLALYLGLQEVCAGTKSKVIVLRSAVPTRDIGFLPGNVAEKLSAYEGPYAPIVNALFGRDDAYGILQQHRALCFDSTSFLRGITLENCVVILDEAQNCSAHELNTIMTRVGENCRVIICGDGWQSDLKQGQSSINLAFAMAKNKHLANFMHTVMFTADDIVRSGFVKAWIQAWNNLHE